MSKLSFLQTFMYFHSASATLEPPDYFVVEQFGAEMSRWSAGVLFLYQLSHSCSVGHPFSETANNLVEYRLLFSAHIMFFFPNSAKTPIFFTPFGKF